MGAKRRHFGTIRKLPSGRWQVRYLGPDGVKRPAPNTFRTRKDAEAWLSRVDAQISEGRWLDPAAGKTTVAEWGSRWLESALPDLKRKTRASYESLWRVLIEPYFGKVEVSAVRPIMIAEWVTSPRLKKLSASRIRQAYKLLVQIMDAAVNNGLISATPCRGIKLPRLPDTEPHVLTEEEVARIAANTREPYDLLIWVLAYSGIRIGEAFALRRRHVDLAAGTLLIDSNMVEIAGRRYDDTPKNHQKRVIKLPGFLIADLRKHLADLVADNPEALLFTTYRGTPMRYNSFRVTHFDPAVQAAGLIDVTPHDLRASHGSWVADRYGVMVAARRLGHANASVTTRHYARAVAGRDAQAADSFDLDRPATEPERHEEGTDEEP